MRRDIERKIEILRIFGIDARDEADTFGERNGVGQRFRKSLVTRKLDDAKLMELEWAEVGAAVIESSLHGLAHALDIKGVAVIVIDLKIYVVPAVAQHLVICRIHGKAEQHRGIGLVMEVAAAILHPFLLQISRHDGDLFRRGAHGVVEVYPVGIQSAVIILPSGEIFEFENSLYFFQSMAVAGAVVSEFDSLRVADVRNIAITQKAAIMGKISVLVIVGEPLKCVADGKLHW